MLGSYWGRVGVMSESDFRGIPGVDLVILQAVLQGRDSGVGGGPQSSQALNSSGLGSGVLGAFQLSSPHPVGLQQAGAG